MEPLVSNIQKHRGDRLCPLPPNPTPPAVAPAADDSSCTAGRQQKYYMMSTDKPPDNPVCRTFAANNAAKNLHTLRTIVGVVVLCMIISGCQDSKSGEESNKDSKDETAIFEKATRIRLPKEIAAIRCHVSEFMALSVVARIELPDDVLERMLQEDPWKRLPELDKNSDVFDGMALLARKERKSEFMWWDFSVSDQCVGASAIWWQERYGKEWMTVLDVCAIRRPGSLSTVYLYYIEDPCKRPESVESAPSSMPKKPEVVIR